jgi:hypothetical protein
MKNYIEFRRIQTVKVPIREGMNWIFAHEAARSENMFDYGDVLDFENEDVIEEDYSYASEHYTIVFEGIVKAKRG